MKRLQCLYKPQSNREYPWALKHPKVSQPLALFKTRKDAMNWFLSKELECATWFQTEDKIWGGLVLAEKVGDIFEYELNVDKFDGGLDYQQTADELNIFTDTGFRDKRSAAAQLRYLTDFKPVYKDMENIEPYFPKDDDFVAPKKSKKDLMIESLTRQIEQLLLEISRSSDKYSSEIEALMLRLNDEKTDKSELLKEIQDLKRRSEIVEAPVVEKEKVIIKEIIKEVPVEVEKIIYKEKEGECSSQRTVRFAYVEELELRKQVEALGLYAHKLQLINDQIKEPVKVSEHEFYEIKSNYIPVITFTLDLEEKLINESRNTKLVYKIVSQIINKEIDILLGNIKPSKDVEYSLENAIYVYDIDEQTNLTLQQALSFVEYKNLQVVFVSKEEYKHAILVHESYEHSKELVLLESFKDPKKASGPQLRSVNKLGLLLMLLGHVALFIILVILAVVVSQ
ncbi:MULTISPECIES: MAG3090 family protein [unclassified Mycoplasma]|uniref:MAG3090 family protein n=1 Tax=unclassified Mycoplasma TaxID=2683645 RepID=UPI00211D11AD|nr:MULTISPECIES: hypothetical protein [unclassified Mycoplasma]UUM19534.1 hypothetical protein NPA11_02000 [Mycoplasma sp. 1578d]UUM24454.1 hypothetical protein NPA12_01980 [Mycoplasma sp. 3686d]